MKYLKTLGILGGMGPEATSYLFNLIIKNTKVKKDQDHIPVVIFNYPQIPDRTLNIVENGESPLLYLIKGMKLLEKAKADVVIIPCNTAHYYIEEINKYSTLPILNMIELTSKHVKEMPVKKIGVMATTGTIRTKLYQRNLENLGLEAVYGKRGVKAGYKKEPKRLLKEISQRLSERGAEVIIAGCTEIPLVLSRKDIPVELVNPMEILAKAAVTYCKR